MATMGVPTTLAGLQYDIAGRVWHVGRRGTESIQQANSLPDLMDIAQVIVEMSSYNPNSPYFRGVSYKPGENGEPSVVLFHVPANTDIKIYSGNRPPKWQSYHLQLPGKNPLIIPAEYQGVLVQIVQQQK